jgi:hypothetical protein
MSFLDLPRFPAICESSSYRYHQGAVEKFSGYLNQKTRRFYNMNTWKIRSIEDYTSAIAIIRNLTIIMKTQGGVLPG